MIIIKKIIEHYLLTPYYTKRKLSAPPMGSVSSQCLGRRGLAAGHQQANVRAIQQDLVQGRLPAALLRELILNDVLQHHVHVLVKAAQSADELFIALFIK